MDPEVSPVEVGISSSKENLEPLLSKSEVSDEQEVKKTEDQPPPPLPYYPGFGFFHGPRPYRDVPATVVFVIFVLASAAWGIFCIVNHNQDYGIVDSLLYNSTSGLCYSYDGYSSSLARMKKQTDVLSVNSWQSVSAFNRRKSFPSMVRLALTQVLLQSGVRGSFTADSLLSVMIWTLVLTLVLSVPFIFGFLWLLKAFARQLVYACLPFFILIPVFLNIFWFVACILSSECQTSFNLVGRIALFIFVFILCGIFAWIIYSNWDRIELTIKIMQTSAQALFSNWMLLLILPALSVVLLIYLVPFIVFLIYAYMNGKIVGSSGTYCEGEAATGCCSWSADKWVPAYYVLTIFTLLWSILLMTEAQVYVLSSTVAQWYFAPSEAQVTGSIRKALKNAFGPSFGTVTFSGLVVSFIRMVRSAIDTSARPEGGRGFFHSMLECCVMLTLRSFEFINKFTINFAAISGESYCNSARLAYELLKRNLLSPVLVEVISTRLLAGMVFVLSVVYAIVVCAILRAGMNLGPVAYYVTVVAWFLLFVIFLLFCQVLDNAIDTIYICYAIDKDSGAVSNFEVHDVYLNLPVSRDQPPTLAVQQP
ncbi:hypothetical protein KP509_09G047300 [Ceratopteris richardii]|uniref:Choline transporter-like protein n=1 Tax=Ceratopteris richardii TaxID=49495 RepID=A0A8T2U4G2_CERRI|nr:hypothetical protein KP509_09G047300 [Ceratopteris richardii]KAH7429430.1 hypothetical protein KP509_09G047300 [Ceratopteris richardii]